MVAMGNWSFKLGIKSYGVPHVSLLLRDMGTTVA